MELNLEASHSPARASASVVLVRDGIDGLEAFMAKRHGLSDVLGGAYVFPGGKVDADDASAELHQVLDCTPAQLHATLNEPDLDLADAAAIFVAAVRETFEESGVLFAQGVTAGEASMACRMLREGASFKDVVLGKRLRLATSELMPWSRWITPAVSGVIRKRFDTRFFVARAPHGQAPRHDDRETTDSTWLAPRAALQQYWDGQIQLAPPQIMGLAHLSRYPSAGAAIDAARQRLPPLIRSEHFEMDGQRVICYPGDERHSTRTRALQGPTRLHHRGGRFEPPNGFEALFRD